jgi:hypothetical protein
VKGFKRESRDPVTRHLDAAFDIIVESPPRPRALRCSGLPYCPILETVLPQENERGDLSSALYMSIGTAMHSALQLFFAFGKEGANVWGSWKCGVCNKEYSNCFRPPECCNLPLQYVETSLRVACMTGHVDMICRYGKRWILLDFKTTALSPGKPKREHLLQVRHYVAMLQREHNIRIEGYYIIYIGRRKPAEERWIYGPYNARTSVAETTEWMFRAIRGYKAATRVRNGDLSKKAVAELVLSRPCHSVADFDAYMSRRYEFSSKDCPMLKVCSKGNRACYNEVLSLLQGTS